MVGQDGMTLLYVPEGEFLRGSKAGDHGFSMKPAGSVPPSVATSSPSTAVFITAFVALARPKEVLFKYYK